ncbi:NADP-dependent malic enzyme, partial [Haemophilus influenzae]
GHQRI